MSIDKKYNNALDYLYSFIDYSLTRSFRYSPEKFDLKRMEELLERLDHPHNKYEIIHIAGTKGKGSTSAFIESILRNSGYKTGLYTSPHLEEFTERIRVCGEEIPKATFIKLVDIIRPIAEDIKTITTFELTTALGFLYFAEKGVDFAVVEVGMGGRLDATNVVTPLVSVITRISYDHTNILGKTIDAIASEKGGIIKNNIPTVIAPQKSLASKVLKKIAEEKNSPVTQVGEDYRFSTYEKTLDHQKIQFWCKADQPKMNIYLSDKGKNEWQPFQVKVPLLGYHQGVNAATAYATIRKIVSMGFEIEMGSILDGFSKTVWPGRFEVLRKIPPVIIDSAHNPESALMLRLTIEDYLEKLPIIFIFGASEDKDIHGMLEHILPRVDEIVVTESAHPRMKKAGEIMDVVHEFGRKATCIPNIEKALKYSLEKAENEKAIIVGGSIFVAAAIKALWQKH